MREMLTRRATRCASSAPRGIGAGGAAGRGALGIVGPTKPFCPRRRRRCCATSSAAAPVHRRRSEAGARHARDPRAARRQVRDRSAGERSGVRTQEQSAQRSLEHLYRVVTSHPSVTTLGATARRAPLILGRPPATSKRTGQPRSKRRRCTSARTRRRGCSTHLTFDPPAETRKTVGSWRRDHQEGRARAVAPRASSPTGARCTTR